MADFRTIIVGGIKLYLFGETERKGEEGKKGNEIENEVSIIFVCHGRMGKISFSFSFSFLIFLSSTINCLIDC